MREADHFYTELNTIQHHNRGANGTLEKTLDEAKSRFIKLVSSRIGSSIAEELFLSWQNHYGSPGEPRLEALGHYASFILGDYDDKTMDLDTEDWKAIAATLSDGADDLDLDLLTDLMAQLLEKGALS